MPTRKNASGPRGRSRRLPKGPIASPRIVRGPPFFPPRALWRLDVIGRVVFSRLVFSARPAPALCAARPWLPVFLFRPNNERCCSIAPGSQPPSPNQTAKPMSAPHFWQLERQKWPIVRSPPSKPFMGTRYPGHFFFAPPPFPRPPPRRTIGPLGYHSPPSRKA